MTTASLRKAIRPLLDESDPADAQAMYYAYFHPAERVQLHVFPEQATKAQGYICLARTGMDLFRPFVTLRMPRAGDSTSIDFDSGSSMIYSGLEPGLSLLASGPAEYLALLEALFEVRRKETLKVLVLDRSLFSPIINILVMRSVSASGLPRFVIRKGNAADGEVLAAAGLNWQTNRFGEIYTQTAPHQRRQGYGKSVVAAAVQHTLETGRTPIYVVDTDNEPSLRLARSLGFVDPGIRRFLLEGKLRPRPVHYQG